MKKNQHGFGIVAVVLILVVIGVISLAGWLVLHNRKDTQTVGNAQQKSTATQEVAESEDTQDKADEPSIASTEGRESETAAPKPKPTLKMLLGEDPGTMYDNVTTNTPYGTSSRTLEVRLITTGVELSSCTLGYTTSTEKDSAPASTQTLTPLATQQVTFSTGWHTLTAECKPNGSDSIKAEKVFGLYKQ